MKMRTLLSLSVVALGVAANAQPVLDQVTGSTTSGNGFASQVFGDFPTFTASVVDNYSGGGVITGVDAAMVLFNSPFTTFGAWDAGRRYQISTYVDLNAAIAGTAADTAQVGSTSFVQNYQGVGATTALVTFNGLSLAAPANGWVGVQGIGDFGTSGQIGVMDSDLGDNNAELVNPLGGFGLPGNHSNFAGLGGTLANAQYRLRGVVPEPTTMIALGAGLAAFAARRRRK